MKTSRTLLSAVVFAGLLSVSAFATTTAAHQQTIAGVRFDAPAPASVVQPTELPRSCLGKTVNVTMTIDAAGQPHDVKVAAGDKYLQKSLVNAVSQWSFTPGRKNGVPIETKVTLPIEVARS